MTLATRTREIVTMSWEAALLAALDDSVTVLTSDGTIVYLNPATERIIGKPSAQLCGRRVWDLFPDVVGGQFDRMVQRVQATRATEHAELYYPPWARWFRLQVYAIGDHVHVLARDVTEHRLAETRLAAQAQASHAFAHAQELDQLFVQIARTLAELIGDGCVVRVVEDDGSLRYVAMHHADPELLSLYHAFGARPFQAGEGFTARLLETGEPLFIERIDVDAHGRMFEDPELREHVARIRVHSMISVALCDGDQRIGFVTMLRDRTPRPYTRDDLSLLQDLTERASMALTRARLLERSQLERRRALAVASASRAFSAAERDERAILDLLARAVVAEVGEIAVANVISPDGGTLQPIAFHASTDLTAEVQALLASDTPVQGTMSERVITTGKPLRVGHIDVESFASSAGTKYSGLARRLRPHSFIMVPIKRGDRVLGTVTASRMVSTTPYSDAEQYLIEELADRAGLAIANGRVLEAESVARQYAERIAEQTRRLRTIGSELSHRRSPREVGQTILRETTAMLGDVNAALWLLDASGARLEMLASMGIPESSKYSVLPLSADIPIAKAVQDNAPIFIGSSREYTEQFPASASRVATDASPDFATACLPLASEGRAFGGMAFAFKRGHTFAADERTFFAVLASQCAQAIDRARLLEQERAATAKLAETNRTLNAVIHSSPAAIIMCDLKGLIRLWNPAAERIFGWRPNEALGTFNPLIGDEQRREFEANLARVDRGEEVRGLETRRLRRDGVPIDVAMWAAPVVRPDGEILALAVFIDITDRKRAEEAARAADRRKDEFFAMLGHELRNPLAPILTALELMRIRGDTGGESERAMIERQTRHLVRLVDDLLDISRVTRGKIELRKTRTDLGAVIATAVEMASPLLEQHNHHVSIAAPRGLLFVDGDEFRLAQVFQNLLTNSAKYTPSGGSITVRLTAAGGDAVVEVEDNGEGIAADVLPTIFEPFVQGTRKLERAQGGLGIGLTLVRSLTELHGGRVDAYSPGPGRGSRFVVRLPLAAAITAGFDATQPRGRVGSRMRRRVLVVDDNQDAADMLAALLRAAGHEVVVAFDGPSALGALPSFTPDVALLDIGLPLMDGYDLARRLKAALPAMPRLIAITGYGQEHDHLRSQEAGFAAHLVKPVQAAQVLAAVDDTTS